MNDESSSRFETAHQDENVDWLIRLRWVAIVGQLLTITIVHWGLLVPVAWGPLLVIVGLTALTNVAIRTGAGGIRIRRPRHLATVMVIDLLALTALLYYTGGPFNPFLVFYFVNLALAAVVLPARWSWVLAVIAVACIGVIYIFHVPVQRLLERSVGDSPIANLYHQGLFAGFGVCALVIVYFITRVRSELLLREHELREAQLRQVQSERLESLATLAAGAGHELASPLSTIAVIANDLSRHLDGADVPESVLEDVALIRSELAHCRAILDRMSGFAGEVAGEQVARHSVAAVLHQVLEGVRRKERVTLSVDDRLRRVELEVPIEGVAQAIRGVITNGIDASVAGEHVNVDVEADDKWVTLTVRDEGTGMPADVLARVGEPFFTTKEVGSGMGLGVFLTRNVLNRLGGELSLVSTAGEGTTATIRIPRAAGDGL